MTRTDVSHEDYLLDHRDLLCYAPLGRKPVLAVKQSLIPNLTSLIHTLHAHPGVAATLALLRERFHWPSMARDVREYVLSCGCRRRRRAASQKIAMLRGRALEPWDILEMDLLSLGVKSLDKNEYLLQVADKASRFPFAFPLPSKQADGVAWQLL